MKDIVNSRNDRPHYLLQVLHLDISIHHQQRIRYCNLDPLNLTLYFTCSVADMLLHWRDAKLVCILQLAFIRVKVYVLRVYNTLLHRRLGLDMRLFDFKLIPLAVNCLLHRLTKPSRLI